MESHVLNRYHEARYRMIGHKVMRSTSTSYSSEGSDHQTSPEYGQSPPEQQGQRYDESFEEVGQTESTLQTSQEITSDDDDIEIEASDDDSCDEDDPIVIEHVIEDSCTGHDNSNTDETSLVEGADYDVIQVIPVNPDQVLDENESEEHCKNENIDDDDGEYLDDRDLFQHETVAADDSFSIELDNHVVSNVDEYFIKEKPNLDKQVVTEIDEYFIKKGIEEQPSIPNVDDFLIKNKLPERVHEKEPFVIDNNTQNPVVNNEPQAKELPVDIIPINDSDLEVLSNIEELKRFLLEDNVTYKYNSAQRSLSVPHSPTNVCLDIDEAKTCLSFEDLDLNLSDLTFDSDKNKSANKSDEICTLTEEDVNSFLITTATGTKVTHDDDLSQLDMEIENAVEAKIEEIKTPIKAPMRNSTSTPIAKPTVLDFCIEKSSNKKDVDDIKVEVDDFVDVESCNDTVIPVLEANNLNALLEQFEANEKLNTKKKTGIKKDEQPKNKLTNGMRLQDAGVQLNKNKMRQILMPAAINTAVKKSTSPVRSGWSDHDYCSPKKRLSLPNIKRGQSLLKPEVLSSNNKILNSRHRSCKNKKVIYDVSSDEEIDKCNKNKKTSVAKVDIDFNDKKTVKAASKSLPSSKKSSPVHNASNNLNNCKMNSSVMANNASKASDTSCSPNSNGSIKLIIKNKSEVILNCDDRDSQRTKNNEKHKSSSVNVKTENIKSKDITNIKSIDSGKNKCVNSVESMNAVIECVKQEPETKNEHFYTALFSNKRDVQVPKSMQPENPEPLIVKEEEKFENTVNEIEQPQKKKKLNLQEYKLRMSANSNNSSAAVSPESIFPDVPLLNNLEKVKEVYKTTNNNNIVEKVTVTNGEAPKKVFDPIREASRKIIMNSKKKQQEKAMRQRDEDIVMSKIPKVDNLQLQPLISDAEMLKIVGMTGETLPVGIINEKPKTPKDYEEIVLVSIGTNTDNKLLNPIDRTTPIKKSSPPPKEDKSGINFKIKKSEPVLKHNVFDKRQADDKKLAEVKIDKERYKGIEAALKSVGKDTKMSSNSLFASIQDVVLKKAPEKEEPIREHRSSKTSRVDVKHDSIRTKTVIVREYDTNTEHGEDKIILHLGKHRRKPKSAHIDIQTDPTPEFTKLFTVEKEKQKNIETVETKRVSKEKEVAKSQEAKPEKRLRSIEKRPRSKERYETKKRSRSRSRVSRRRRSHSRSKSPSRSRYRRYRSPFRRSRRSRSPYRASRRSPSYRRYHSKRSPSPRQPTRRDRTKSPVAKKVKVTPPHQIEKTPDLSLTPPLRKPTVSESSEASTSSSSSGTSSSSASSEQSKISRCSSRKSKISRRSRSPNRYTRSPSIRSRTPRRSPSRLSRSPRRSRSPSRISRRSRSPSKRSRTPRRSRSLSRRSRSPRSVSPIRRSRSPSRRSHSPYRKDDAYRKNFRNYSSDDRDTNTPVEERRIVFVGRLDKDTTKMSLRAQFSKFGQVNEVRIHSKDDGSRYGFVTYLRPRDAWSAVEAAASFPQYDVGFGGRRAFCRQSYADLDGLEAKYTESAFHGQPVMQPRRNNDMSFEQMLLEMKKKLSQRKNEKKHVDECTP